jgi:methyl-accepting chemotaxis protein
MFNSQRKTAINGALAQAAAISKSQALIEFISMERSSRRTRVSYPRSLTGYYSMFVERAVRDSSDYREFRARLNGGEFQAASYSRVGKGGKQIWIQASSNSIFDAKEDVQSDQVRHRDHRAKDTEHGRRRQDRGDEPRAAGRHRV